jgi:hypothetical protein
VIQIGRKGDTNEERYHGWLAFVFGSRPGWLGQSSANRKGFRMSCKFVFATILVCSATLLVAEDRQGGKLSRDSLKEPLFRISKARLEPKTPDNTPAKVELKPAGEGEHPLDPAIRFAKDGLERIRTGISDYSCTLVKQERIGDELYPQEYMYAEVRNRKVDNGKIVKPFSVYMYFLKPEKVKGREVLFVESQNEENYWRTKQTF